MTPWKVEMGKITAFDDALILKFEIGPHWAGGYLLRIVNTMEDMTLELKQCDSIASAKAAANNWMEKQL